MNFVTWGFVNLGSGKKQFTVLDKTCGALPYGTTLKLGRIEKMLAGYESGALVNCIGTTGNMGKINVQGFATTSVKGISGNMGNQYFVTIVSVSSQVVMNLRQMTDRFGSAALVRTAWFSVAENGKPYTLPVPFDSNTAEAYANDVMSLSNAKAVVVNSDGTVISQLPYPSVLKEKQKEAETPSILLKGDDAVVEPKKVVAPAIKSPEKSGGYFFFEEAPNMVLSVIASKYRSGFDGHVNILVTGESGTGKTTVARKFAEEMGWACHRLNCALITEPSDIAGQRGIKGGETTWEWSAVAKAMQDGNCVVILVFTP